MLHVSVPNLPETLTYSILAAIGIDVVIALLLAIRGDWLGVVLMLAIAALVYWFVCRQLVAVVSAGGAAAASGILLLLCGFADFAAGHPYLGLLLLIGAIVSGFVFVLLQQGASPAELRVAGVLAVGAASRAAQLRMLEELHDAGLLTDDELAAKRAQLAP